MKQACESFIRGGLFVWAFLFLFEAINFHVYQTLPIGFVPTVLLFASGGGLGICHWFFFSDPDSAAGKSLGQNRSSIDRYEEWKRFSSPTVEH